ncbi:MAG: tyrosine-type recombinase/integrase [Thermoleophilia bacterium]
MASIHTLRTAKGERRYEVRYRDERGGQHSKAFTAHRDARAFKIDVERRRQAGILFRAPPERFDEVAAAWLRRFKVGAAGRVRPRPKTVRVAEDCLRHLAPLNPVPVERISRSMVEDLITDIAARAPRRAEMTLSLLKRILRDSEDRGQNVDAAVHRVRVARVDEREPRFLTWEEGEEMRSWMPEYVARIVPVAILTMLRRGELLGLREADVDLENGSIAVLGQRQEGEHVAPKTRAGRRSVDLGPLVIRLLREQQLARTPNQDGYLFPTRSGRPFDGDNFMDRVFKPAARSAGIPELTFHDLRHTGASLMIAAGCHVKVIAEQMGHSDGGALVLRRYGHLYKGARRLEAARVEAHVLEASNARRVRRTFGERQMGLDLDAR